MLSLCLNSWKFKGLVDVPWFIWRENSTSDIRDFGKLKKSANRLVLFWFWFWFYYGLRLADNNCYVNGLVFVLRHSTYNHLRTSFVSQKDINT